MRRGGLFGLLLLLFGCAGMQRAAQIPAHDFDTLQVFRDSVTAIADLPDPQERMAQLNALWDTLTVHHASPLITRDSVGFLYRGAVDSVWWKGTFTNYGQATFIDTRGQRIGNSDIWMWATHLPQDARVDYWLEVNDGQRFLDPINPKRAWINANTSISELGMPRWKPSPWVERLPDVAPGTVSEQQTLASTPLRYTVGYWVYTPPGYERMRNLPVLYATDGHAYLHEKRGSLTVVLDNLIARKKIRPIIVVFIDPRDPADPANNRRQEEFKMNPDYGRFIAEELVPTIDATYKTDTDATSRGMLGFSFGGLNAAYFGIAYPHLFGNIAMQSPALHGNRYVYHQYATTRVSPEQRFFISTGTIVDTEIQSDPFVEILEQQGATYRYLKVSDGHTLLSWRHQLADILRYFWGR